MRKISLDCLTLPDATPVELIGVAAKAGFTSVSLWVQPPVMYPPMFASPEMRGEIARALADNGIALGNLEVFNLNVDEPIAAYEPALALGASMGARSATAINYGSLRPDIVERLVAFHALCTRHGMEAYLEPISMGATRTLEDGVNLIGAAGVDVRLVVDIIHLIRTGGSPKSLGSIAPERIGHIQICDGPAIIEEDAIGHESIANRMYPGEGEFPLVELLRACPSHATLGVETPNLDRQQRGLSPLERAREAMRATQDLLKQVEAAL